LKKYNLKVYKDKVQSIKLVERAAAGDIARITRRGGNGDPDHGGLGRFSPTPYAF
jgi:hypothetical protein